MEGCGGDSGAMRDLLQNHLLQRLYLNAIGGTAPGSRAETRPRLRIDPQPLPPNAPYPRIT